MPAPGSRELLARASPRETVLSLLLPSRLPIRLTLTFRRPRRVSLLPAFALLEAKPPSTRRFCLHQRIAVVSLVSFARLFPFLAARATPLRLPPRLSCGGMAPPSLRGILSLAPQLAPTRTSRVLFSTLPTVVLLSSMLSVLSLW